MNPWSEGTLSSIVPTRLCEMLVAAAVERPSTLWEPAPTTPAVKDNAAIMSPPTNAELALTPLFPFLPSFAISTSLFCSTGRRASVRPQQIVQAAGIK
jgi:hypothetical protein